MVSLMKRIVIVLLSLFVVAEVAVRIVLPSATISPDRWRDAGSDALCGAVRYATDANGQRARATERLASPLAHPLLIVGGKFTAAPGLALSERYPERLERRARAGGFSDVVALAVDDLEAAVRSALQLPRAPAGSAGPPPSVTRHATGPDVLVIELDAAQSGADDALFTIQNDEPGPAPFQFGPVRVVDAWELFRLRRWRRSHEAALVDLVQRDGLTGRGTARMKQRLDLLTQALRERSVDAAQLRYARAALAELHGLSRSRARATTVARFTQLFTELRDQQRAVFVLVTGPTVLSLAVAQTAESFGHVVVHAPPFELDPQLRVMLPSPRPAGVVHAQVADTLWAALSRRGLLAPSAAAPAEVIERADAIEQSFQSRGGFDESTFRLLESQVSAQVEVGYGPLPLSVLSGVGEDGRFAADGCAELVLRRPSLPTEFVVRCEVPAGQRPLLELRYLLDRRLISERVSPKELGAVAGRIGLERLEWSFAPPAPVGPIDYPGIELQLAPEASSDRSAVPECFLREARFLVQPPE